MPIRQDTLRMRWFASTNYAASTQRTYTETLEAFQRRYPQHAERIRQQHLVDFLCTEANGQPATRAPSTLDRQRTTLRVFWKWCQREGYLRTNPAEGLEDIHLGSGERRMGRWLTREEVHRLLDACEAGDQGQRDRTLILLAVLTGLRRAELAGLRWRAVDLTAGRITVRGKGGKMATIGIPDQARHALMAWRTVAADRQGRKAPGPDQPVIPTGRKFGGLNHSLVDYAMDWNTPLTVWAVRTIVARRAEDAGLGTVGTHDLRRTFAGLLDADGVDLKGIQAALRHSSPDVTARCYLDRSPRRAVEAVALLRL